MLLWQGDEEELCEIRNTGIVTDQLFWENANFGTMGNSNGKEQRPSSSRQRSVDVRSSSLPVNSSTQSSTPPQISTERPPHQIYSSRNGRGSRSELASLLTLGNALDRDTAGLENRRETKQEREARKLEKERVVRERERVRSMREENVDGGYLVTQGVYTGLEDYSKAIVRQLMVRVFR